METTLNKDYWNERYLQQDTGWDLKQVSPALKNYIDQLTNKNIHILIPGCGNAWEAKYLAEQGFSNITLVDIAPALVEELREQLKDYGSIKIICSDFFELNGLYDLILEQTFFCALHPSLRKSYSIKMHQLLKENGKLVGVLFNTQFEKDGPPFGGSIEEYEQLFLPYFQLKTFAPCYNSYSKRQGTELFIQLIKK